MSETQTKSKRKPKPELDVIITTKPGTCSECGKDTALTILATDPDTGETTEYCSACAREQNVKITAPGITDRDTHVKLVPPATFRRFAIPPLSNGDTRLWVGSIPHKLADDELELIIASVSDNKQTNFARLRRRDGTPIGYGFFDVPHDLADDVIHSLNGLETGPLDNRWALAVNEHRPAV